MISCLRLSGIAQPGVLFVLTAVCTRHLGYHTGVESDAARHLEYYTEVMSDAIGLLGNSTGMFSDAVELLEHCFLLVSVCIALLLGRFVLLSDQIVKNFFSEGDFILLYSEKQKEDLHMRHYKTKYL